MAALTAKCGGLKLSPWTCLIAADLELDVGAASKTASSAHAHTLSLMRPVEGAINFRRVRRIVRVSSLKLIRHGDVCAARTS
jgi:hypothetical protein